VLLTLRTLEKYIKKEGNKKGDKLNKKQTLLERCCNL